MYYLSSENIRADQLHGYREADLRLCFRICKNLVFSQQGSVIQDVVQLVCKANKESMDIKISLCIHCAVSSLGSSVSLCINCLLIKWGDAQADLSFCWVHRFSVDFVIKLHK